MIGMCIFLLLFCALLEVSQPHAFYLNSLPNADRVTDPCDPSLTVVGLGHRNSGGGGHLNDFGKDFNKYKTWEKLCPLDSDGDGFTNGEELGDPNCIWTVGAEPNRTNGITHPGVCTPVNSTACKKLDICNVDENDVISSMPQVSFEKPILITATTLTAVLSILEVISLKLKYHLIDQSHSGGRADLS